MFTGLVEAAVPLRAFRARGTGGVLVVPSPGEGWSAATGDSVAVCGVCLTVAALLDPGGGSPATGPGADMAFDLSAETLERTWLGQARAGRTVNLERAARLGDPIGGHLVQGHVDGGGTLSRIEDVGDGGRLMTFEVDPGLERYLIEKGSIALDGISLTVVEPRGAEFDVAVIPETLERTNLGDARPGQRVHVEADLVGKWIERLLAAREQPRG